MLVVDNAAGDHLLVTARNCGRRSSVCAAVCSPLGLAGLLAEEKLLPLLPLHEQLVALTGEVLLNSGNAVVHLRLGGRAVR